jgi:hypothetical protein
MDHPCYKCGHSVDDGKPFCAQCGAPQIRVSLPEPAVSDFAQSLPPGEIPAFPDPLAVPGTPNLVLPSTLINWSIALRSCAIAAAIAALVMALGLMVPLLAVLGAGFLAVNLYHRRNPAWNVTPRSGALLGALCGVLFFGISAIFEGIAVALFHTGGQVQQKMLDALQQAASRSSDPQVQAAFERLKTPEGLAVMLVFGVVVLFFISIAAGSLAGALAGTFVGRRNRM